MKKKVLALLLILGCGLTTPIIAGAAEQNESAESSSDADLKYLSPGIGWSLVLWMNLVIPQG